MLNSTYKLQTKSVTTIPQFLYDFYLNKLFDLLLLLRGYAIFGRHYIWRWHFDFRVPLFVNIKLVYFPNKGTTMFIYIIKLPRVQLVVHACALCFYSTRAGGKCKREKFNCVVWSRQAEAAVSAQSRDCRLHFSLNLTHSDWRTGKRFKSSEYGASPSLYRRKRGPVCGCITHLVWCRMSAWRVQNKRDEVNNWMSSKYICLLCIYEFTLLYFGVRFLLLTG